MMRHPPELTADQADVASLVASVVADTDLRPSDERPSDVLQIRCQLAELGIWTLGVPAPGDGAEEGAEDDLAAIAFACLGQGWPALAWAAVQAHAALEVLGTAEPAAGVRSGRTAVAVIDSSSPVARLAVHDGWISGSIDRIDPAGESPYIIVLGNDSAQLLGPELLRFEQLRRTGLDGALTSSAVVVEPVRVSEVTITGVDVEAARTRLWLGAAAIAAGIASAAAEAALEYSAQRVQFGAPLTALPSVREALFLSSAAAATSWRQVLRPRDCSAWQAAAVLDAACERAIDTCASAIQSHGGYGYLTEYRVERMLRDAVSLRAACDVATARRAAAADLTGTPAYAGKD